MSRTWFSTRLVAVGLVTALLPACGGDDDGGTDLPDAPPGNQVDAGAQQPGNILKKPSKSATIAISDDDKFVVMVNPEDNSISIFQTSDFTRKNVPTGREPSSVVIAPDSKTAYVSNRADATVVKVTGIDTATPQVSAPVATGSEPTGVALSPTGATLFVAEFAEGSVLMIDTATMTKKGDPIKGAINHPRAVAVTNDGDSDDNDELLIVPEFFGETNANANNANTLDTSRDGRVRIYDLSKSPPEATTAITFAPHDTGISPGGAGNVSASPNQLWSVTIRRDATSPGDNTKARIYIPSVSVAPQRPTRFDGNVYPVVYVGDLGARAEVTSTSGTTNLSAKILAAGTPGDVAGKLFLADIVDMAFVPGAAGSLPTEQGVAYVVARGADAVQRVTFADTVSVGGSVNLTIDVIGGPAPTDGCKGPNGIVIAGDGSKAFVNCWISKRLGVVTLGNTQALDVANSREASTGTDPSVDKGRRFYFTGRGRWSGDGTATTAPTHNNLAWSSCGSCHPDGLTDNVTWIFGTGARQTTSMDGSFSKGGGTPKQRAFNWTAINDEIHDFERNTRETSGGLGAITTGAAPCVLTNETRQTLVGQLGKPVQVFQNTTANNCVKDFDDMENWVKTIRPPKALQRLNQTLVDQGRELFKPGDGVNNGACANCHGGPGWTISRRFYDATEEKTTELALADFNPNAPWPAQWNKHTKQIEVEQPNPNPAMPVGPESVSCTIRNLVTAAVAQNTFGPAELEIRTNGTPSMGQGGYNVPSLYGLSLGAPYLHSGQAKTLRELFDNFEGHLKAGNDNFLGSSEQKDALAAYLLSIDANTPEVQPAAGFDKCGI